MRYILSVFFMIGLPHFVLSQPIPEPIPKAKFPVEIWAKLVNFEIYKDVYRYYSSFGSDVENFYEEIRKDLHKDLLRQFIKQYSFIDKYNDNKNLKNYYLILSILFQILGLTFLLLLFKELINIFKVKNIKWG